MLPQNCRTVFVKTACFFSVKLQYRFFCWEFTAHEEEEHVKGALYIGIEELLGMITCVYMKK